MMSLVLMVNMTSIRSPVVDIARKVALQARSETEDTAIEG